MCSKGGQRAIDELQRTISEIEAKYKAELGRLRKKFETDIREYEIQVETLNRANAELGKNGKAATTRIRVRTLVLSDTQLLYSHLILVLILLLHIPTSHPQSNCSSRHLPLILTFILNLTLTPLTLLTPLQTPPILFYIEPK